MKVDVINFDGAVVSSAELSEDIFCLQPQSDIIYKVIHWQLAKRRAGTHQVKERGDVAGSTRKIRQQKGSGGARHGAIRAAQFRGGGIIFGPHFRSHEYKLNKKLRALGLKHALSTKLQANKLIVLENTNLDSHKTKDFLAKINKISGHSSLIIDAEVAENLRKSCSSCSNLHKIDALPVMGLNVYDVINHDTLILTVDALKKIEERLS
jgi:large subunit ribosomal protein L4